VLNEALHGIFDARDDVYLLGEDVLTCTAARSR
jgi:hypothetical protein